MADDKADKKSPALEAAELRKTLAEAEKAEIEVQRERIALEEAYYFERRKREKSDQDAYDEDRQFRFYFNVGVSDGSVERCRARLKAWQRDRWRV